MDKKVVCEKCGKTYYMTNKDAGCPYCVAADNKWPKSSFHNNKIAIILKTMGWVILVLGLIGGVILGKQIYGYGDTTFNFPVMCISWITCGISSLLFFALAEIIQILHDIRNR